jgi:NADPH:quinone reductase-like Zn-dependent oxidoreductase/acyl carrier protein
VDLSRDADDVEVGLLVTELETGGDEDQIGLRGPDRFVARLRPWSPPSAGARSAPAAGRAFLAGTSSPGILDGLCLREVVRRTPAAGEVEIRIEATGLNFMNVMSALGVYPGYPKGVGPLGIECAGKITAVGDGVQDLQPGDDVLAVAIDCLASHTLADARLVRRRPAGLAVEQAATLPIVYLTAHYALNHLARLRKGERVLIHAAAGGVGLAAIQIAHHVGAEVFATAGSPEKRSLVESMGVRHVMDSRSLAFRDQVLERTAGEGVDVVLNSLAGEFVPASLGLLRPYGRFLEIGKKDIYRDAPLGLAPFRRSLSYFAIDLDRMIREVPEQVSALLDDVLGQVESGALSPVAVKAYPVSRMGDAFRDMAQARHTGKIAIALDDPDAVLEPMDAELTAFTRGTCLITGGLGALGLAVADWLADRGVPALVLAGRRPPTADAEKAIAGIERKGARVRVVRADVAAPADARRLASEIDGSLPPLSGIVHAAGLLDDGILLQQTPERFARAMAPKVQGAWHAHELADSRGASLVLFSSVASLLGLSGQANYAAGNAFLDALARYRGARGKPGVSINWGPWGGIGLAAAQGNRGERLSARGLVSIAPAAGLEAFETVLCGRTAQVAVMPLDWPAYAAAFPAAARASLVRLLAARHGAQPHRAAEPAGGGLRESLRAAEVTGRRALLESFLQEQVAHVLKQARNRIDVHKPFRTLGLDSLMALELRNRLEAGTGIALPATLVWNYPTVEALAPFLAERLDVALDETRSQPKSADDSRAPSDLEALVRQIEQLSAEEARRLLSEEP